MNRCKYRIINYSIIIIQMYVVEVKERFLLRVVCLFYMVPCQTNMAKHSMSYY